jgi:hypothetical protein
MRGKDAFFDRSSFEPSAGYLATIDLNNGHPMGVVTVTGTGRIETFMATLWAQTATPAALFHSAMALRR